MTFVYLVILLIAVIFVYQRYFPPAKVDILNKIPEAVEGRRWILDIREYQDAEKSPIKGAFNVPLAYLNRHYPKEMPQEVVIVANDRVEVNLSCKLLSKKGYHVSGYHLCPVKNKYQGSPEPCVEKSC
ncbi:rhodanese-like domain-containing protein [Salisediminibacterium selenitireducens]|uniref:Rhodanese domain protein n=1 Tax=Bacillus selenitireducens (strain ATCC 700615 / DSM 15326 / MLS10) TaxID=439292 RepID=D6XUL6_BACIE|nr:hypothetical protein [Salisediminibacterium selenitireducens]ADH99502.1 hypothetical protein Bsel_1998 [[Bacillus] selenitireducens MLS10]